MAKKGEKKVIQTTSGRNVSHGKVMEHEYKHACE